MITGDEWTGGCRKGSQDRSLYAEMTGGGVFGDDGLVAGDRDDWGGGIGDDRLVAAGEEVLRR